MGRSSLVLSLALLAACTNHGSGPTFGGTSNPKVVSVFLVVCGSLLIVGAIDGPENDEGEPYSPSERVAIGGLGAGLIGLGWLAWPSPPPP